MSDLKRLAQRVIDLEAADGDEPIGEAWDEFEAVATPSAVLALIAENERLSADIEGFESGEHAAQVAEELGHQLGAAQAMLETAYAERDHLKAENAGLRTGYEAYEQVVQGLKAENEALRSNADLLSLLPELDEALEDLEIHGQHSDQGYRKLKDWYRKIDLACKAIDAAMSKEGGRQVEPKSTETLELEGLKGGRQ